jgi:urate oxidase
MPGTLTHNAYGKSQVRLTKVIRHPDRHELKELDVAIQLEGDFEASYLRGDNSRVVATDTMKNIVYVLARKEPLTDLESFGKALGGHFLGQYVHVRAAVVRLTEQPWQRLSVAGVEHPHAFIGGGPEKRTCTVSLTRDQQQIESGLEGLLLLKTTNSAFRGYIQDQYTTLPETDDRLLATELTASWQYGTNEADWNGCHALIRRTLLEVFAGHRSQSVQQTLYAMAAAALEACLAVEEITLTMPNKHRLLVNLRPFGLDNANELFVPIDEPYGLITGTVRRGGSDSVGE